MRFKRASQSDTAPEPQRNDPDPQLIADIDTLEARCSARLDDWVAEERALRPGIPPTSHRHMLTRGDGNIFRAVRRILTERAAQQASNAQLEGDEA